MAKNIVLFASGSGTNAQNICEQFAHHPEINVVALFCNNPNAKVIERMAPFNVPVHIFNKEQFKTFPRLLCELPTEDMRKEFVVNLEKIVNLMVCSVYK